MWFVLIIGVVLIAVAGGLIWSGRRTQRKVNVLRQAVPTPAGEVAKAFPGELVTVRGTARGERNLISEQGQVPCIYYSYSVVREYERTEQRRVGQGRNRRTQTHRTRTSETLAQNSDWTPFAIEDETGSVRVDPDGAEFDAREVVNRYEPYTAGTSRISFGDFSINIGSDNRTLGHRFTEQAIPTDEPVFVLGAVNENGEIGKSDRGSGSSWFVISHRDDRRLREDWESSARWQAYSAIVLGVIGVVTALVGALMLIT